MHCATVCAADYPLTEDYAHFAAHISVLKPPPGPLMQLSNYNFNLCCYNEIIYLSHIIYFNF